MLPAQFIVLLLLAAMPAEIAAIARAEGRLPDVPDAGSTRLAFLAYGNLILMHILLCVQVFAESRRTMRKLHGTSGATTEILGRMEAIFFHSRLTTIILTAAILLATPLPEVFFHWRDQTSILKHIPMLAELFFLMPAILTWLAIWTATYFLEEAGRQRAMPYRLDRGQPVHDMPSLGAYLLLHMRHNFFPIIFMVIATTMDKLTPHGTPWGAVVSGLGLVVMVICVPIILTRIWATAPLPGVLRERLVTVAGMYKLRFRNVLLWKTHHLTLNAAIVGWFPGARYFLMSDVLLESNTDKQIEAVFAHEVGHGVHWHIPWYIATIFGALMLAGGIAGIAISLSPVLFANRNISEMVMGLGLSVAFAGFAIYTVAPRFEHQADWFACRHMARVMEESPAEEAAVPADLEGSLAMVPTIGDQVTLTQYLAGAYPHSGKDGGTAVAEVPAPPAAKTVLESGSEVFISALLGIVDKTQRALDKRDLMHPSINDRVALLRKLARDEDAEKGFNRKIVRTRAGIVGLLLLGGSVLTLSMLLPIPKATAAGPMVAATRSAFPAQPLTQPAQSPE